MRYNSAGVIECRMDEFGSCDLRTEPDCWAQAKSAPGVVNKIACTEAQLADQAHWCYHARVYLTTVVPPIWSGMTGGLLAGPGPSAGREGPVQPPRQRPGR